MFKIFCNQLNERMQDIGRHPGEPKHAKITGFFVHARLFLYDNQNKKFACNSFIFLVENTIWNNNKKSIDEIKGILNLSRDCNKDINKNIPLYPLN